MITAAPTTPTTLEEIELDELGIPKMVPTKRNTLPCPTPGIYSNEAYSMEDYHKIDAANASTLKEFCKSGWHGAAYLEGETKNPSNYMLFGTACHSRVFEPKDYEERAITATNSKGVPIADGCTYKTHAKAQEENPGAIILHAGWAEKIEHIAKAVMEHPDAKALFFDPDAMLEATLIWHKKISIGDIELVIPCKARLDMFNPKAQCIPDLKVTDKADPYNFSKKILDMGWHRSGGWYVDGCLNRGLIHLDKCGRVPPLPYPMLAVERESIAPGSTKHLATIHAPAIEDLEQGYEDLVRDGLSRYIKFRTLGIAEPPTWTNTINPTGIPTFAQREDQPTHRIGE